MSDPMEITIHTDKARIEGIELRLQAVTIALAGLRQTIDDGQHDVQHMDIAAVEAIFDDVHFRVQELIHKGMEAGHD